MGPIRTRAATAIAAALLVLPLASGIGRSQTCGDYTQYLRWKSATFNSGGIAAMVVHDDLLYYGSGAALKVAIPGGAQGPVMIATAYDSLSALTAIAGAGQSVYVGNASGRIVGFDVSQPTLPVIQDFLEPDAPVGGIVGIEVSGDVAYAAQYSGGVDILDISDPSSLSVLGTLHPNNTAWALRVDGPRLYLTTNAGLEILDITDPAAPVLLGAAPLVSLRRAIEVVGTTAYVADGTAGLQVIDVSDPTSPSVVRTITEVRDARDVVADEARLFVSDFEGSGDRYVWILDISVPESPVVVGPQKTGGQPEALLVHEGELYVEAGELVVYQGIHRPLAAPVARMSEWKSSKDIQIVGTVAYVPDYYDGLRTIDISDPTQPVELGLGATTGNPLHVSIQGNTAYVAAREGGLSVVDVTDPALPAEVASYDTAGLALKVDVQDGYAYVAADSDGLVILDVSDPSSIGFVSASSGYADASTILVEGEVAYVGSAYSGLHVVDVSDPTAPTTLANEDLPGLPVDFTKVGDLLYSLGSLGELRIWDVADPEAPDLLSTLEVDASSGLRVRGDHVYMGSRVHGVMVADVSDPTTPWLLGNVNVPGIIDGLALSDDYIFTASPPVTMAVVELQCPHPTGVMEPPSRSSVHFTSVRPNPFNPRVVIEFEVETSGPVRLDVYDLAGRHVRSLVSDAQSEDRYRRVWDGRDDRGRAVGSGVYLARARVGGISDSVKVTLIR